MSAAIPTIPIGKLIEKVVSWNPPRDAPDDELDYIDLSSVDNKTKQITSNQTVIGREAPSRARQRVKAGDILVSTVRPNLNGVARVPDHLDGATASTGFCLLRPQAAKLDASYLFHWVQSAEFVGDMMRKATGASYPAVSDKIIAQSEIPLPPLDEQMRIAAILDQADDLRRKRQRAIDRLNQLGHAIFHQMFGDLLLSSDSTTALGNVCDVRDGTHDSPKYVDNGFPLLTSKNFSGGHIDYAGASMTSERDFIQINKRSKVDEGDIVMPMIGTIGSPVIVDFEPDFAIKNVALIKFKNNKVNASFIRQVLDGPLFRSHVENKGRGGTQKFISLGDIRGFQIPLPSIDQQDLFSARIQALRIEKARHSEAKSRSELLFSSLQHHAFQGEL